MMGAETVIDQYNRRHSALVQERSSFLAHWKELADYVLPFAYRQFQQDNNNGNKKQAYILDNTATIAHRSLYNTMMTWFSSPSQPWFRLSVSDPIKMEMEDVKNWLYETERRMRYVFDRSNLYTVLPIAYSNLSLFGPTAFLLLEDKEDIIRCYPLATGSYCLAQSSRQSIDTVYRELSMTIGQLVEEFGFKNVSASVQTTYKAGTLDAWIPVIHVIEPRNIRQLDKKDAKNKAFASIWYEKGSNENKLLRESGYDQFPVMVGRWSVTGEDIYGNSPGMDALPDIKMLQLMTKKETKAIEMEVDPPLLLDANARGNSIAMVPGGLTYISGAAQTAGAKRLVEQRVDLQGVAIKIQAVQQRIKRTFFEDITLMLTSGDDQQKTATEINARQQEKLILGPVTQRINNEIFSPLIERTFAMMLERGLIPPPPESIQGQQFDVEYISVMAQAQKQLGIVSIERLYSFGGNLAASNPDILDKFDFDQSIDEYASMIGAPPRVVRSDDKVAVIRQGRQQAQQMQQMANMAQPLQQTANAARLLSETDTTSSNALTQLFGGGV